jgi:hypothetical protein
VLSGNSAHGGALVKNGSATLADVNGGGKHAHTGGLANFGALWLTDVTRGCAPVRPSFLKCGFVSGSRPDRRQSS